MLVWIAKTLEKLSQFGICSDNWVNLLLPMPLLCLESVIIKDIMVMLHILLDMIYLKYIQANRTFGFLLILDSFMLFIFLRNIHILQEVNNMHFWNKIWGKLEQIQTQNGLFLEYIELFIPHLKVNTQLLHHWLQHFNN